MTALVSAVKRNPKAALGVVGLALIILGAMFGSGAAMKTGGVFFCLFAIVKATKM